MATQTQIDDVLAKAAAYQAAKVDADADGAAYQSAGTVAGNARSTWEARVAAGATGIELGQLLVAVLASGLDVSAKFNTYVVKNTALVTTKNDLDSAIETLLEAT